jgi:hypothetical protein
MNRLILRQLYAARHIADCEAHGLRGGDRDY